MNMIQQPVPRRSSRSSAIVIALAAAGSLLATAGEVQARQRNSTITGANGKTAERSVTRAGGDVSSTTTGPNGKTWGRNVDRSLSGATAMATGPNGKTASRVTERTSTGSQSTLTGPNGKTGSVIVTR